MNAACDQFLLHLMESMDGSLDPAGQRCFDEHLLACSSCAARMRDQVVLRSVLKDLDAKETAPPPPLPESIVSNLVAAMRKARDEGATSRGSRTG